MSKQKKKFFTLSSAVCPLFHTYYLPSLILLVILKWKPCPVIEQALLYFFIRKPQII